MNGGVWFVTRLWLSEVARCTQRAFFEATTGECGKLDTTSCQYGMNGDALMKTIRTCSKLHEQDALIFSARAPLYRCDCMLSIIST
ncbi:unnamed protein product [Penicillium salamii]|nr:unnamed protein product [Penicillium salamii]CAG8221600.1 unnamed protein product [Penicillium salamii]